MIMAQEYLVLFQHGPVQEFIATARRTDDFWAGSFLLSHATQTVIHEIQSRLAGEIIFPITGSESPDPLGESELASAEEDDLEAALPNRVAAVVKTEDEQALRGMLLEIKKAVRDSLVALFEEVESSLTGKRRIAARQIDGFFESFFVIAPYDESQHAASFELAQIRMDARKNIRNFIPSIEDGFKCTQCGCREPMKRDGPSDMETSDLHLLRKYWAARRSGRYGAAFKENEMLCAVCCGKRLLRRVHYESKEGIPSTSALAVAAWVDENSQKMDDARAREFVSLLKMTGLNWKCTPVKKNRDRHRNKGNSRPLSSYLNGPVEEQPPRPLLKVDGDFFFPDSYDRFSTEVQNGARAHVASAKRVLLQLLDEAEQSPSRYLAVVTFDADGMGEVLRQIRSKTEHKALTLQLASFASEVKRICHDTFHGHVIYVGGDEGVVLAPLSELLQVMEMIRMAFHETMQGKLTLSAGAAVIHHQSPLGQGIKAAHEMIEKAKSLRGKDAFAVSIIKRSGSRIDAVAPWSVKVEDKEWEVMQVLKDWFSLYRLGSLSPRWFYQTQKRLAHTRDERGKSRLDIGERVLFQILPRHTPEPGIALELAGRTVSLMAKGRGLGDFSKLMDLLYLPLYLFQGGNQ